MTSKDLDWDLLFKAAESMRNRGLGEKPSYIIIDEVMYKLNDKGEYEEVINEYSYRIT